MTPIGKFICFAADITAVGATAFIVSNYRGLGDAGIILAVWCLSWTITSCQQSIASLQKQNEIDQLPKIKEELNGFDP